MEGWNCQSYSHSIVAGGLVVISYTTREIFGTSFTIREDIFCKRSYGSFAQVAVIISVDSTTRRATTSPKNFPSPLVAVEYAPVITGNEIKTLSSQPLRLNSSSTMLSACSSCARRAAVTSLLIRTAYPGPGNGCFIISSSDNPIVIPKERTS